MTKRGPIAFGPILLASIESPYSVPMPRSRATDDAYFLIGRIYEPLVAFDFGSQVCRLEPCRVQIKPVGTLRTLTTPRKSELRSDYLSKVLPLLRRTPFDFASRHPRRQAFRMGGYPQAHAQSTYTA